MSTLEGIANGIAKFKLNFLSVCPELLTSYHNKEETRQFRLCDFLAAYRGHHLKVETGPILSIQESPAIISASLLCFNRLLVRFVLYFQV